ncbi:TonB-dependent receptor [Bacteroides helcogenes]|nr:TonB-dependent receptor [Bacteroides helcogenes]MDY5239721.1 TonB-dependent receptor [Bacteroides helcogenes]
MKRPVSINVNKKTVESILPKLFPGGDVAYKLEGSHIILTKNEVKNVQIVQQSVQGRKVTGVVVDEMGEPVIGAAVRVKNGSTGAVTDLDGKFTLDVPVKGQIEISFIGYKTQVLTPQDGKLINVQLEADSQALDEVVVVGYGTSTKRSLIASVSKVETKGMEAAPTTNITEALAGRAPGLVIQGNGGGINKSSTITIRGGDTPLVVIDGIIREYQDFKTLAPGDVESVSILKDASSTAVYGSRAANGIIQVVTKKGKEGKMSIDYNYNLSLAQPSVWRDRLSSAEIAEQTNIAYANDGRDGGVRYTAEEIQKYRDGSDPFNYPNTDWRSLVLRDWAPTQKHNITMAGGTETNNYVASLGYIDQQSLYRKNTHNMQRYNVRLTQSAYIKAIGLRETASVDGYAQETTHPYSSTASGYYQVFSHIQNKSPMSIAVNKFGNPYVGSDNPVAETSDEAGYLRDNRKMLNAKLQLEWDVPYVQGLNLRGAVNYNYYIRREKDWRKDAAQYEWESTDPQYAGSSRLSRYTASNYYYTWQWFANYNRKFGKHDISALAGYEATYGLNESESMGRTGYVFNIDQFSAGPESTTSIGAGEEEYGRAGWVGQAKYNYDQKYFAEFSLRYDGSDMFPKNKRWGTFWAGSLGWSVDQEKFMESLRDNHVLDMLKLRASYGEVGADNWGKDGDTYHISRYSYLSDYGYSAKGYVINGQYYGTFYEKDPASTAITWFTSSQANVGFDFASLNNRLYGSFDYFYYKTKGFIYAPAATDAGYYAPLGTSLPKISTDAEYRRGGYEFQLGWRSNIGDFKYDVSANWTYYNTLWANDPSESITSQMNPRTRRVQNTDYYTTALHCLGFFTSDEEIRNSALPSDSYNLQPGDLKYEDVNGDGVITGADAVRIGSGNFPHSNFGISLGGSYKGWSLNVLFQGASSFNMYLGGALQGNNAQSNYIPVYSFQTDYWTPENTNAKYPRLTSYGGGKNGNNNYLGSDFWLINGSYIRLKDFSLAYDFKYKLLKNCKWITKLQASISGQNIFTISEATKYGMDPENASNENYGYPNERVIAFGINVGF